MPKTNVKPIRKVEGKTISLDHSGRLNLHLIIDIWKPNRNSLMFATWRLLERLNLTPEEAKEIGLETRPDGSKTWKGSLPAKDFEFTPPEREIIKSALEMAISGGLLSANSRPWLEPLMSEFLNEEKE